jgi:tetratricopeptide (TPR) repeat protein
MLNSSRVRVFAPLILIALCFAMPGWAEVPPALDPGSPLPLELAAEQSARDPARRAQLLLEAADRRARRLDTEAAQRHYAKAVSLDTTLEPRAARGSGDLHAAAGEHAEALSQYERARKFGHEGPRLLVMEARSQNAVGRKAESVATYQKILEHHDKDHGDALAELGALHTDEGRAAEAVPLLERAKAQNPKGGGVGRSLAKAPEDRFQSAREVGVKLQAYLKASG